MNTTTRLAVKQKVDAAHGSLMAAQRAAYDGGQQPSWRVRLELNRLETRLLRLSLRLGGSA